MSKQIKEYWYLEFSSLDYENQKILRKLNFSEKNVLWKIFYKLKHSRINSIDCFKQTDFRLLLANL